VCDGGCKGCVMGDVRLCDVGHKGCVQTAGIKIGRLEQKADLGALYAAIT